MERKKNGEKQNITEWHRIIVWGKLAETCKQYLEKGKMVLVEGRLQTSNWKEGEDSEGKAKFRYLTEVVATTIKLLPTKN